MSTVEQVTIFLAVLQTALLAMYGWETFRLRRDAAEQNKFISQQVENASQQNKLIGGQLKVMADGLEFQRQTIEQEAEPAFHLSVFHRDTECCKILLHNFKENVLLTEFRTNDANLRFGRGEGHKIEFIMLRKPDRQIYIASVYKTYRAKLKAQVFSYYTGDDLNIIKPVPDYDYRLLFVIGQSRP